jgi:hypothetical protein
VHRVIGASGHRCIGRKQGYRFRRVFSFAVPSCGIEELVETYVDHDQWFRQEVEKGLAQLDRGEFIEHDEVMARTFPELLS